jgi:YfiH family protein
VTANRRIAIGVLTADCLPLVLAARDTGMFSVIHAGWQGTLLGIAVRAVQELAAAGAVPGDMMAVLGPSIGSCCYQVGDEVYGAFEHKWRGRLGEAFRRTDPWHLDLQKANRLQLQDAGIRGENIAAVGLCTCCRRDLFFSHRRDGVRTGRMLAFATAAPAALPPPARGP